MPSLFTGINLLLIILGFGVLIFVHELGHFIAAKWAGIRTEAFAVGMGPVAVAWRKGIGIVFGSTHPKVVALTGKAPNELKEHELKKLGLGETEYSLRWLPIGGFVKMLGQEDANPAAISDDPRSYNRCPIGKRMIVVSAGVIMNIILAVALFVIAFTIGVQFDGPVVGRVAPNSPADNAVAINASEHGIERPGLHPGDRILRIDGEEARTFADVMLASAMSRPNVPLTMIVERPDIDAPLEFVVLPRQDHVSGLLSIGVAPGSSTRLLKEDPDGILQRELEKIGLAGVKPGMKMIEAGGRAVATMGEVEHIIEFSHGQPLPTVWAAFDDHGEQIGEPVHAMLGVRPQYQRYLERIAGSSSLARDEGLLGFCPLVTISTVDESSPNKGVLHAGDVILKAGAVNFPRTSDFIGTVRSHRGKKLPLTLRRGNEIVLVEGSVNSDGQLVVIPGMLEESMEISTTVPAALETDGRTALENTVMEPTPAAALNLLPGTRIEAVGSHAVGSWREFRQALQEQTQEAHSANTGTSIEISVVHPTPGHQAEKVALALTREDVHELHELSWFSELQTIPYDPIFEPLYVTLSSEANPLRALSMGFRETYKSMMQVYLTIDRLFRGSVGVEQLRGPVGIVHIGTKIADRGLTYLVFFLAMISVNLAVINFLPLPIVDGGLFLFLVYEKLKGRPPSIAFQNAATVVGLFLIGAVFLVTFYNDVVRLFS